VSIVFVDVEVNNSGKVIDYGAYIDDFRKFHGKKEGFRQFIKRSQYVCGHNILMHDLKYINDDLIYAKIKKRIDTLPLSALLYAEKDYHPLVKDYKLDKNLNNNPQVDASLAHTLFYDEVEAFKKLPDTIKSIYFGLLGNTSTFSDFFDFIKFHPRVYKLESLIKETFIGQICNETNLTELIKDYPIELAYCLAVIRVNDLTSIPPEWVIYQYPHYYHVMEKLRNSACHNCQYCKNHINATIALNKYFGFEKYRTFNNENLQEQVVNAQLAGDSIMAVFPTGGGKSLTFQIPALMMGETVKGLTIVISPLQSLMNDQVENLTSNNINNVGTINGSMNAIERLNTVKRVKEGKIHLLYIAPESLRSPSIHRLLSKRNLVRFVIDEAHCFSTWGHDFRVDYQYIAEFINSVLKVRDNKKTIPISCFTATAKKEVIDDINQYFMTNLNHELTLYKTDTRRKNLSFFVKRCEGHVEKMNRVKQLLDESGNQAVIIYTSRRRSAERICRDLVDYGYNATDYHGGMNVEVKNFNQLAFTRGEKNIIVATSAFGMGVDKKDVAYVIHYQVSPSIEDYLQEAGRGGRDENMQAQCHVLYDEHDIDLHFNLLTQTKLTHREINTLWKTIKKQAKNDREIIMTAKELARNSGWNEEDMDIVTKVTNSILALEKINYLKRGMNSARVIATSLVPKTMIEASSKIHSIPNLDAAERDKLLRIMTTLYTDKTTNTIRGATPITGIDDLYDRLDLEKFELIKSINILKDNGLLNADNDLLFKINDQMDRSKSIKVMELHLKVMRKLINYISFEDMSYNLKELNTEFEQEIPTCSVKAIRLVINYLDTFKMISHSKDRHGTHFHYLSLLKEKISLGNFFDLLGEAATFIIDMAYKMMDQENKTTNLSMIELKAEFNKGVSLLNNKISLEELEMVLLYLHRVQALSIDGGFLVTYNPMRIQKIEKNPKKMYTLQDYKSFEEHYEQKTKKIHMLTLFLERLEDNVDQSMILVDEYFNLPQKEFEKKYITADYKKYYDKAITAKQYNRLYGELSNKQKEIIDDKSSQRIVVLAGPGSGKTKLLVHKLAALVDLEDVKLSELLMLTFSRSATVVFKERLNELIGSRANYVSIRTFHSYCFDIIGQVGNIDKTEDLFNKAIEKIKNNEVDESILNVSTLVIDEAQDMSEKEFEFVNALIEHHEESLKVIAVGDDDQNIFEFRNSDSKYMMKLLNEQGKRYELLTNYRSKSNIVDFTQQFIMKIERRFKDGFIESYTEEDGTISLFKFSTEYFYQDVVKKIKSIKSRSISVGLLTFKNEDAEIYASMLIKEGVNARLIQSNRTFRLNLLYEMDWFLSQFNHEQPVITEEIWKEVKRKFEQQFKTLSICNPLLEVLKNFEKLYPNKKFRLDLQEHIKESKLEELYLTDQQRVIVSTIHKSKGREFDAVILVINQPVTKDEDMRAVYVALTRAKNHLVIHTNQEIFDDIEVQGLKRVYDDSIYEKPDELVIQMEHSDINLGGCKYCVHATEKVMTDTDLTVDNQGCNYNDKKVLYFSSAMNEEISKKAEMGYKPTHAVVSYKVKWHDKDNDKTYWLLLPKVFFKRVTEQEVDKNEESNDDNIQ
jgi:ATP-dependent DNA helicase RecQ